LSIMYPVALACSPSAPKPASGNFEVVPGRPRALGALHRLVITVVTLAGLAALAPHGKSGCFQLVVFVLEIVARGPVNLSNAAISRANTVYWPLFRVSTS